MVMSRRECTLIASTRIKNVNSGSPVSLPPLDKQVIHLLKAMSPARHLPISSSAARDSAYAEYGCQVSIRRILCASSSSHVQSANKQSRRRKTKPSALTSSGRASFLFASRAAGVVAHSHLRANFRPARWSVMGLFRFSSSQYRRSSSARLSIRATDDIEQRQPLTRSLTISRMSSKNERMARERLCFRPVPSCSSPDRRSACAAHNAHLPNGVQ